jgi:DNA segregation ATPase FtsK/SpoIIIE, S-DNA-T family
MSQLSEPSKMTGKNVPASPVASETPAQERGDLVTDLWLRFGRFGWDVLGVSLIAFSFVTLIGFLSRSLEQSWAQGFFISPWVALVSGAFGWGWPLVVLALGLVGVLCLHRRFATWPIINLGRVIALEVLAFALLAFLSILGGLSLDNAEAGRDGGWIGWGLAELLDRILPLPWSSLFLVLLMFFCGVYGTGLLQWAFRRLLTWLDTINPAGATVGGPSMAVSAPVADPSASQAPEAASAIPDEIPLGRNPDLPPLTLLMDEQAQRPNEEYIRETALRIEQRLAEFGVPAHVVGFRVGPTVTQYALEPGFVEKPGPDGEMVRQKVRVSQISALSRDLALALSAERLRIEAPVPGRSYVGIEVPNQINSVVRMRGLLESEAFGKLSSPLAVVIGRDVSGQPVVADLARMPHLLIAGTTGSGKSVFIAALATCLAMNNTPADLRIAMLDPKMVELVRFNGLPHLYGRVETEVERMMGVLRWAISEMDRRYRLLEEARTRDVIAYNRRMVKLGQPTLPRIVVIVDELADLMMTSPDQTEHNLIRLAQMARATGIHLVVATQRPSTDVVTGLIKANFPARLAFTVASSIDSRVILDTGGAESLLGKGDLLFLNPESGTPMRAQGAWVADPEIDLVINFWKEKMPAAVDEPAPWEGMMSKPDEDNADALIEQAVKIVRRTQRASASLLQRRLRIGYPRAARLMDELEELGVVGPGQGGGREREVLLPPEDDDDEGFDEE